MLRYNIQDTSSMLIRGSKRLEVDFIPANKIEGLTYPRCTGNADTRVVFCDHLSNSFWITVGLYHRARRPTKLAGQFFLQDFSDFGRENTFTALVPSVMLRFNCHVEETN